MTRIAHGVPRLVRNALTVVALTTAAGCASREHPRNRSYLFVWAGPHQSATHQMTGPGANDFLAVIDADPASATYGGVITSKDVGVPGMMAHHTELALPSNNALFASDFETGQIFVIDVADPRSPKVIGRIDSVPGFKSPHSFARLANGHVVAAMQYGDGTHAGDPGGLVEFDAMGKMLRASSSADSTFRGARIRTNGVELLPAIDRILTTSMPMSDETTADVIQVWRLSDLHLLRTIALPIVKGDSMQVMPYDARILSDGRTAMLNSYYCGLWRVANLETDHPVVENVGAIRVPHAAGCAVAAVLGHYWIVPSADAHLVVVFDVADPSHPVEASRLVTDSSFMPHWISPDPSNNRVVITGADEGEARVFIADIDPRNGRIAIDQRFRDAGAAKPGIAFSERAWPHAFVAHAMAHGAVFGPAQNVNPPPAQR